MCLSLNISQWCLSNIPVITRSHKGLGLYCFTHGSLSLSLLYLRLLRADCSGAESALHLRESRIFTQPPSLPHRPGRDDSVRPENHPEEASEVSDGVHQSPNLRAGEALPVPEVPVPSRPGPDRAAAGPDKRAGHHVVSEPASQAKTGPGGNEGRRGVGQGRRPGPIGQARQAGRPGEMRQRHAGPPAGRVPLAGRPAGARARSETADVASVSVLRPHN